MSSMDKQSSAAGKEVSKPGNESHTNLRKRIVEGIFLRKGASSSGRPHCLFKWCNRNGDGSISTPPKQAKYDNDVDEIRESQNRKYVGHPFRNEIEKDSGPNFSSGGQGSPQKASESSKVEPKTSGTNTTTIQRDPYFRCSFCEMPFEIRTDRETHEVDCLVKEMEFLEPVFVNGAPVPSYASLVFAAGCKNMMQKY